MLFAQQRHLMEFTVGNFYFTNTVTTIIAMVEKLMFFLGNAVQMKHILTY